MPLIHYAADATMISFADFAIDDYAMPRHCISFRRRRFRFRRREAAYTTFIEITPPPPMLRFTSLLRR